MNKIIFHDNVKKVYTMRGFSSCQNYRWQTRSHASPARHTRDRLCTSRLIMSLSNASSKDICGFGSQEITSLHALSVSNFVLSHAKKLKKLQQYSKECSYIWLTTIIILLLFLHNFSFTSNRLFNIVSSLLVFKDAS